MTLNKTDRIVVRWVNRSFTANTCARRFPAEAELCEEFATSRNIIREVFRSLI